jgi:serine/threonine-protein kinase
MSALAEGTLVGERYRIAGVIGEGSQSVVYRAERASGGGPVALKVIHRHLCGDAQLSRRFQREAKILRGLQGEHIVKLLDVVEEEGLFAIALEHVEGTSLEAMLEERAPLDLGLAIEITLQICAALGAAHASGIVHRDLKPANVLVERAAGGSIPRVCVKVVDFGLGKILKGDMSTGLTDLGMIFGTPEYMSPEQARGDEVDARADLYAAGVILYQMTTGVVPFTGETPIAIMDAHMTQDPRPPRSARPDASITPPLEKVMLRALAKDPAQRYATARELAQAIAAARDEPLVIAPSRVDNPEEIAQSDTDLHLSPPSVPSIEAARTLRADEVAALAAHEQNSPKAVEVTAGEASRPPARPVVIEVPVGRMRASEVPSTLPSREAARPKKQLVEISDEPTAVSGEPPRRAGWVWAVVAIVAAAVGVVIGILAGAR